MTARRIARQIAVRESRAAELLDMRPCEFRDLVKIGVMPRPRKIGDHERWLVADLEAIADGDAFSLHQEDIEI